MEIKLECGRCKTGFTARESQEGVKCPMCGYSKQDVFENKLPEGKKILKG